MSEVYWKERVERLEAALQESLEHAGSLERRVRNAERRAERAERRRQEIDDEAYEYAEKAGEWQARAERMERERDEAQLAFVREANRGPDAEIGHGERAQQPQEPAQDEVDEALDAWVALWEAMPEEVAGDKWFSDRWEVIRRALADRQRVPDEIRRLPDELRITASRSQDGVREGIEEAADELERAIAKSGGDHE